VRHDQYRKNMSRLFTPVLLCVFLATGCALKLPESSQAEYADQTEEIWRNHAVSTSERVRKLRALPTINLEGVSPTDPATLSLALNNALTMAHFDPRPTNARNARLIADVTESKGGLTDEERLAVHHALVAARLFEEAAAYQLVRPIQGMLSLGTRGGDKPAESARGYWTVEDTGVSFVESRAQDAAQLIVVAHPSCGFSRRAMSSLMQDSDLKQMLPKNKVFLVPQTGQIPRESLVQWNRANPSFAIQLVHSQDAWPEVTYWSTPNFYAVKAGKVVGHLQGWPQEGRKAEMLALLKLLSE
jgi:hypothetical protein